MSHLFEKIDEINSHFSRIKLQLAATKRLEHFYWRSIAVLLTKRSHRFFQQLAFFLQFLWLNQFLPTKVATIWQIVFAYINCGRWIAMNAKRNALWSVWHSLLFKWIFIRKWSDFTVHVGIAFDWSELVMIHEMQNSMRKYWELWSIQSSQAY